MSDTDLAPRSPLGGLIAVWATGLVAAIVIGIVVPQEKQAVWIVIAMGGVLMISFAVQLAAGRVQGFIRRVALGALGAMVVMGVVSAGFGVAALIPG